MLLLLSLLFQMKSQAQIFTTSQDPARVRWSQIRTAGYKFIYPEGYDSLAASYAKMFERFRKPVSATSGFLPARVPVVLHPLNAAGEYSLSKLPSVINMSLLPQGKYSFSYPVSELAAVSLSRQAAHMNFASSHVFKPFTWIFGELFPFAIEMLYPDKWLLSGDAAFLEEIGTALRDPVWGGWIGRKHCIPATPVFQGIYPSEEEALAKLKSLAGNSALRIWQECSPEDPNATLYSDIPVDFARREFRRRAIMEC